MSKEARTVGVQSGSVADDSQTIDINLDAEVVEFFMADGPGWQVRMNAALRQFMRRMH